MLSQRVAVRSAMALLAGQMLLLMMLPFVLDLSNLCNKVEQGSQRVCHFEDKQHARAGPVINTGMFPLRVAALHSNKVPSGG